MRKTGRGETVHIGGLFEQYKKRLTPPQKTTIDTCISILNESYQIHLTPKECRYSPTHKILTVTAPGPIKTEIKIHKEAILKAIQHQLGVKGTPKDII